MKKRKMPTTMRKREESLTDAAIEALRMRESYLSAIIENQPGLIWLKDREGKFLAVNTVFANSCGINDPLSLVGKTDFDIWPRELAAGYVADDNKVITSGKPVMVEEPISDKGDVRWFETFKNPVINKQGIVIGTTGYSRDITERKRMEDELQKAQKLESLGVLAGGIAHDFNNLLTGVFGYIDLARSVSKEELTREYLSTTIDSINRARALTQQLLTFAKGGAPIKKTMSLVSVIQESAQFALSGSPITCTFSLPEDLWLSKIDKDQIGQVIDNIVINAKQAMPNEGSIEITAENISLGNKEHPLLAKGNYVKMSFKDFGIGIPKEVMPRIFDPFYTTKSKGHGLGLATCYSIIKRHGGAIDAQSEPGKGTTFCVYLPASEESAFEEPVMPGDHRGTGTIMVMDDDEMIRTSVRKMLEMLGYEVVCRNDGKAAVDSFLSQTRDRHKFVALFFDLTIPGGMGGIEAVAEIRKRDKEIPVMVLSGYSNDAVMKNPGKYGFTASISKPFTLMELSEILKKHLTVQ